MSTRKCPVCEHENPPGDPHCQRCGARLEAPAPRVPGVSTATIEDGQLDTQPRASVGTATFGAQRALHLDIRGSAEPLVVYPAPEIVLGRRDPITNATPDVDLTPFAGYRMGVSRRHAAILLAGNNLHLTDLDSSNGTFLNGQRLAPNRPYTLHDGDEVRLGQLVMGIRFG